MAKGKRQNKIDPHNLSTRDRDFLLMDTAAVMKKYKVEKQAVYDRRFALKKKLKEAGVAVDQEAEFSVPAAEPAAEAVTEQPVKSKRGRKKKVVAPPQAETEVEKTPASTEEKVAENREVMVVNKQVPVIMKPITINFDNFSIKLNGVPKKISVNPDTNAIEIDL